MNPDGIISAPGARKKSSLGRPTKDGAVALAAKILAIARRLFLEQGFERTSLNQIAAIAGVTKRTIYIKLGDKEELLALVVAEVLGSARRVLDDLGPDCPTAERLERFGQSLLAIALDPDVVRLYRLTVAEVPRFPVLARLMDAQLEHGSADHLTAILIEEVAAKRLAIADPVIAAKLLVSMILAEPHRNQLIGAEPWTARQRRDHVAAAIALFLSGARGALG